jgi:hypothetical protein
VGGVPHQLALELRDELGLVRAVETGTYHGGTTRELVAMFEHVVTIELSAELFATTSVELASLTGLTALQGDSAALLPSLVDADVPTLWFLDGHWSGGATAGQDFECPVLAEIAALADGHPDDCVLIDDARLFAAPPPPPHDPIQWPTLMQVLDALRAAHTDHHLTVLADLVIAVPSRAKTIADRFGQGLAALGVDPAPVSEPQSAPGRLSGLLGRLKR